MASLIIAFIVFLGTHQHLVAVSGMCAMLAAGMLFVQGLHDMRPQVAYATPQLPPINLVVCCSESNGKWSIEAKLLDWSR